MKSDTQNYIMVNEHLSRHPRIRNGAVVIHGTRIPAHIVKGKIDNGYDRDEYVEAYRGYITHEQVDAAYNYATEHPEHPEHDET